jgi:hypothetical protein
MNESISRPCRRVGLAVAVTALWLGAAAAMANAAFADTATAPLKDSQKGSTASAFASGGDCSGYAGSDTLWHFVVPALDASPGSTDADIVSITASFNGGSVTGTQVIQNGKGVNVFTSGATTVVDAAATLSKPVSDDDAVLVLSRTCAGSGATTGAGGGTTGGSTGASTGSDGGSTGATGGDTTGTTGGDTTGTGGNTSGNGGGDGGGAGSDGGAPPLTVTSAPAPGTTSTDVPPVSAPLSSGSGSAAPFGVTGTASGAGTQAAPGAVAAPAAAGTAGALPFTGAPTGVLAMYALGAIGFGVLLQQAGRTRLDLVFYRGRHVRPRAPRH